MERIGVVSLREYLKISHREHRLWLKWIENHQYDPTLDHLYFARMIREVIRANEGLTPHARSSVTTQELLIKKPKRKKKLSKEAEAKELKLRTDIAKAAWATRVPKHLIISETPPTVGQ